MEHVALQCPSAVESNLKFHDCYGVCQTSFTFIRHMFVCCVNVIIKCIVLMVTPYICSTSSPACKNSNRLANEIGTSQDYYFYRPRRMNTKQDQCPRPMLFSQPRNSNLTTTKKSPTTARKQKPETRSNKMLIQGTTKKTICNIIYTDTL
ncbi:hypothetical protein HELRODRAFT_169507 [Helobdella robusta]|uniref:Uncharacterized protein n=1 Tax=Helobdella robusta TaxID=6412 RepID=T1F210_HELRO|nr:hypothetical protein HELRODRAFT_169507 [Helobdella robusta]ESO08627.1 hypothetical protein HELRODRAFT_169507 [Helobdella robusta]